MHDARPGLSPAVVDGLVVGAVGVAGGVGLLAPLVLGEGTGVDGSAVVLTVVQAGALWWRRHRPLVVLAVTLAALLAAQALGDLNAAAFFGPHAAAYAVAAYADRTGALAGLGLLAAGGAADGAVVALGAAGGYGPVLLGPTGVLAVFAWGVGRYVQVRRAYLDTVLAYTHRLEHDRDEEARRAVREERRRIARELHDQVAHHLGVISLQLGAAQRWLDRDREQAATALAAAESASRAALQTMPVILQALRTDDTGASRAPQPSLADVHELVERVRAAGVAVDLVVAGEPRGLPPGVELAAYRVLQEALTNVIKHAGPATATVHLRYGADRIEVEVDDDGHGLASDNRDGTGLGLVGMRERVELLDGTLEVGPRDGGGFRVRARLPATRPVASP